MTHAPSHAPAEVFAEHLVALLAHERNTFAYKHFLDETHTAAAETILTFVASPTDDFAVSDAMRYFAAAEVVVSILVNALSSVVVLTSTNDELTAAIDDIDLFRRSLSDHLCEGLLNPVSKLVNMRVLALVEGCAQRTDEAAGK